VAHAETSAGRSPGPAEAVAVLGAGGTMGFAIARRLGQATAEHGDEDVSAIYLTSAPEHTH
jgi:hypothetical protein